MAEMRTVGTLVKNAFELAATFGGNLFNLERIFGIGRTQEEKSAEGLKAKAFGIGPNDQALFWDAVALALAGDTDALQKTAKLVKIFEGLTYWERVHFYGIVGVSEQEEKTETDAMVKFTDKHGNEQTKPGKKVVTEVLNKRGRRFIQYLANLPEDRAIDLLKKSSTLAGPVDNIKQLWTDGKGHFERLFPADKRKKWADDFEALLQDAENHVAAKEAELDRRLGREPALRLRTREKKQQAATARRKKSGKWATRLIVAALVAIAVSAFI